MFRMRSRPLRALQVEVSSRCTRRCALCPRATLAEQWIECDLDLGLWERLQPDLVLAEHVHLQGWGEPLLHPRLSRMAADARAARCTVGITTNGDLLCEAAVWITGGDVDVLTVSVSGAAERHERWRDGSSLDHVLCGLERVATTRRNRKKPRLQLSYMLLADNVHDLAEVLRRAASCGCDELFVVHPDHVSRCEHSGHSVVSEQGVSYEVRRAIDDAARSARKLRIGFRPPALEPQVMVTCALDPVRFASVAADGGVGPCVHLNMPVRGAIPRCAHGEHGQVERVSYGSLRHGAGGLGGILSGVDRQRFAAPFELRMAASRRFQEETTLLEPGAQALRTLDEAHARLETELAAAPFPPQCQSCLKRLGW